MTMVKKDSLAKGNQDVFLITGLPGFAALCDGVPSGNQYRKMTGGRKNWSGTKTWNEVSAQVRSGDLSGVPASDKIMSEIETANLVTPAWEETLDVVGGIPNVPAFLSGQPLNMRRMERVAAERGPMTMFASLELSMDINQGVMRKRGAAILALVRALSPLRPVDLYACCSVGDSGYGVHVLIKIDTTPLDLARAAHVLTDPGVTRGLCYGVLSDVAYVELRQHWTGNWAYGNHDTYRKVARDSFISVTSPGSESLLIPAAHSSDACVNEPIKWIKGMIREYGGLETE